MKEKANIIAGLDLGEMDPHILVFLSRLSDIFSFNKITFVHVIPEHEFHDSIEEFFPDLDSPLEEIVQNDIENRVAEYFNPGVSPETEIQVIRGDRVNSLVELTENRNIDLLVMGIKQAIGGTGIEMDRVAAYSDCSTLFIPENARSTFKQILAMIDFDRRSRHTLRRAVEISRKSEGEVHGLHFYNMPYNYFRASPSEKLKEKLARECRNQFRKFSKRTDFSEIDLLCEALVDDRNDRGSIIVKYIRKYDIDLLITGLREKSDDSAFFVQRVTEKIRAGNFNRPFLVVKEKDRTN